MFIDYPTWQHHPEFYEEFEEEGDDNRQQQMEFWDDEEMVDIMEELELDIF